jgi:hypothetical protein
MRRTILPAGGTPPSFPCSRPLAPEGPYSDSELSRPVGEPDADGRTVPLRGAA